MDCDRAASSRFFAAVTTLSLFFAVSASASDAATTFKAHGVEIRYTKVVSRQKGEPPGSNRRFMQVTIVSRSGVRHTLHATLDELDESDDFAPVYGEPDVSPSGRYVVLQTLEAGEADDGDEQWWHEVTGCVFVDTDSGRVVGVGTDGECAGEFSADAEWTDLNGQPRDLERI